MPVTLPPTVVRIDYTNHCGVRSIRTIIPHTIEYTSTRWHPEEQWILHAWDCEKDVLRSFAIKDIHGPWMPVASSESTG